MKKIDQSLNPIAIDSGSQNSSNNNIDLLNFEQINQISSLLNTGLSDEQLSIIIELLNFGVNPEQLARLIIQLRNKQQHDQQQMINFMLDS